MEQMIIDLYRVTLTTITWRSLSMLIYLQYIFPDKDGDIPGSPESIQGWTQDSCLHPCVVDCKPDNCSRLSGCFL